MNPLPYATEVPRLDSNYGPGDEPINGYRLESPLGRGGFGEVWKCVAPGGLFKAMKIVSRPHSWHGDYSATVEHEYEAVNLVKDIRHPYLVSLDRVDLSNGELIIVMDLAESNLQSEFERCRRRGQPGIPDDELLHYLLEAAEALDVLNFQYGLQHLDVKPANLLISNRHVRLADFSLVKHVTPEIGFGRQPVPYGFTPRYAAPELLQGEVSRFCDQYSLAFVYQELLTGYVPFEGSGLLKRLITTPNTAGVPEMDRMVLARALSSNPNDRFSSCLEFVRELIATKAAKSESRVSRVWNISSVMERHLPRSESETTLDGERNGSLVETQRPSRSEFQSSPSHSGAASSADTPRLIRRKPASDSICTDSSGSRFERAGESSGMIYPLTIHLSDLRWRPGPDTDVAPTADEFVDRLVAAVTELGCIPRQSGLPTAGTSAVLEDSFMTNVTAGPDLQQEFDEIVRRCRGEEILRTESGTLFAVEGTLPIWELFSSKQRVLRIAIDVARSGQPDLSKVSVRIEPLSPTGASLHARMIDIRSQVQSCIREVLREVPERRRGERAACNFGVELYPVLGDWHFGPCIAARAINISARGIGLSVPNKPSTKRLYLRPKAPNPLSSFAILTEVVRHSQCDDGTYNWGAALGIL